jgi:hypothetical protein
MSRYYCRYCVPGKTPREAVKAYLEPLQRNVAIVCNGVLRVNNYDLLDEVGGLTLEPVPLNGRSDLYLSLTQQHKIIKSPENGPYRVKTLYYSYAVETEDAQEIVGYHWHPHGVSPVKFPHLHLGPAAMIGREELSRKAHFPTGRIAFEDVVELLITTFGAEPDRPLWQELIERTRSLFSKYRTW